MKYRGQTHRFSYNLYSRMEEYKENLSKGKKNFRLLTIRVKSMLICAPDPCIVHGHPGRKEWEAQKGSRRSTVALSSIVVH